MKQRVISAIIAIAILAVVLVFRGVLLYVGITVLGLLAYKEFASLKAYKNVPLLVKVFGAITLVFIILASISGNSFIFGLSYKALAVLTLVIIPPSIFIADYKMNEAISFYGFTAFIGLAFNSIILTIENNLLMFIYLILITIITDTFAMLIGMFIGKHKLIPSVSPKKTVEGSVGGSIIATIIATIFYVNLIGNAKLYLVIPITLLLSVVGQIGDLLFSKIKRENEIKDYSNIMPGHGGILDRLDSIILVVVTYILFYTIL